jgi:hypothetical protein
MVQLQCPPRRSAFPWLGCRSSLRRDEAAWS